MYCLTIFKSTFDNKTNRVMELEDWDSFVGLLKGLSEIPLDGKKNADLISPAIYEKGTTRSNKNVMFWGKWAAIDVDEYEGELDDIINRLANYNTCIYSTASSKVARPKFRIVFDLDRSVASEEFGHFWYALNREFGELGDGQTKDASRMFYIPADYRGAFNFFLRTHGDPISIDVLKSKHEYVERRGTSFLDRLPPELQQQVIDHRKAQASNKSIVWSSYSDCPFFPKPLAKKYQSISQTGWYHTMYCIMVAIASNAIKKDYPITADEIARLCKEFDAANGNWYQKRPMKVEANSALEYAYRHL